MTTFLVLLALGAAVVSAFFLTPATFGVGAIAFACLLAILARIAQAAQHREHPQSKPGFWSEPVKPKE